MWWKLWVALALYGAVLPLNQGLWSKCKVYPVRCFDSDTKGNEESSKCTIKKDTDSSGEGCPEYGCGGEIDYYDEPIKYNEADPIHFCEVFPDKRTSTQKSWLPCNKECFNKTTLYPLEFGEDSLSMFCKTKAVECLPKFNHKGKEYQGCTSDSIGESDEKEKILWCATEVDEKNEMVHWGQCDLRTCESDDNEIDCDLTTSKCAVVTLTESNGVSGTVEFKQSRESGPLYISGQVSGLKQGKHGFHAHEKGAVECTASGGHFNPSKVNHGSRESEIRHVGDFGNIEADENGVAKINMVIPSGSSLFNEDSLIGKTLVIHADEDDHGLGGDAGSEATGNAGDRLTCGIISEKTNLIFIIIIVLAVIIVLLLILITVLVIYCCKGPKPKPDGKPYQNGDPTKAGFGDDLSIPFIDDSPRPTPRVGRSTERLSFFNRTPSIGRSRGSLSNEEAATVK